MTPRRRQSEIRRPTEAELRILQVLWGRGSSTVREVLDVLSDERETGYTTVLKQLQIMTDKGLVLRDDQRRPHVFTASQPADRARRQLLGALIDNAFGGSAHKLMLQALRTGRVSRNELQEIREIVEQLERNRSKRR